jgi:uncharacterized protein (DUF58 family)
MLENAIDSGRLQEFASLELIARQVVEGFIIGLHKSPFHGFSVEFAEHRLYNAGESTRHIDWKLFGRTDRMYVKRYEEETNLRCHIILDHSSSMYYPVIDKPTLENPDKITFSVYAAAALMYMLKQQRDAFGLSIFSDKLETHISPRSSSVHHKFLLSQLDRLLSNQNKEEKRPTNAATILHQLAESLHKRSLVIIFSDMMESQGDLDVVFSALQHLKHNKHEVILFHTLDRSTELDFSFSNRPYRFVDLESGSEVKLLPSEIRNEYLSRMQTFSRELEMRCGQYQIDFIEADIKKGFRQILLPYLLKREKLY